MYDFKFQTLAMGTTHVYTDWVWIKYVSKGIAQAWSWGIKNVVYSGSLVNSMYTSLNFKLKRKKKQDIHARTYTVCTYSIILANLAYLKRTGSRKFQVVIKIQFIWCVTYSFESTEELRLQ